MSARRARHRAELERRALYLAERLETANGSPGALGHMAGELSALGYALALIAEDQARYALALIAEDQARTGGSCHAGPAPVWLPPAAEAALKEHYARQRIAELRLGEPTREA